MYISGEPAFTPGTSQNIVCITYCNGPQCTVKYNTSDPSCNHFPFQKNDRHQFCYLTLNTILPLAFRGVGHGHMALFLRCWCCMLRCCWAGQHPHHGVQHPHTAQCQLPCLRVRRMLSDGVADAEGAKLWQACM